MSVTNPSAQTIHQSREGRPARIVRGSFAVIAVCAAVGALRLTGALTGAVALGFSVLVVLALPTSRSLANRVLWAGSLFLGWISVIWWRDLPLGDLGRVTVLLMLLAAGLAGWVAGSGDPRARVRLLLPAWRTVDVVLLAATAGVTVFALPWLRVRTGPSALAMMLPGWDNSAHFNMVQMLRRHGATTDSLGQASGEAWKFGDYPQGFHAAVATVVELMSSPAIMPPGAELAASVAATGWVAVLAVTTLAAGLCTLPGLRTLPAVAAPLTALVVAAFLLGPGAQTLPGGFPNFFLACVLTACVPIVAIGTNRTSALPLAALGGLLVGVAQAWILLLTLALPAAALILLPWRRDRQPSTHVGWAVAGLIVLLTGIGGLQAVHLLSSLDANTVLTTQGGITVPELGTMATILLANLGLSAWAVSVARRADGESIRSAAALVVTLAGLVGAGALAWVQVGTWSTVTYYFWKYAIGLELVALVLAVIAAAAVFPNVFTMPKAPGRHARVLVSLSTILLTAAATQAFGFTGLPRGPVLVAPSADGMARRAALAGASDAPSTAAQEIVAAAGTQLPAASHGVYLSAGSDLLIHPVNAQQWYLALTSSWTVEANDRTGSLMPAADSGPGSESESARANRVLAQDEVAIVIVAPGRLDEVRTRVDPKFSGRVTTWRVVGHPSE